MPTIASLDLGNTSVAHSAWLDFNTTLPLHFTSVQVVYWPSAEPSGLYDFPHLSLRLWFYPPEFALGIECNGTTTFPCAVTPFLAARFGAPPPVGYFPSNYTTSNATWLPATGGELDPNPVPTNDSVLVLRFGTYDGEVIFYELLVSGALLSKPNTTQLVEVDFPHIKVPVPGSYYHTIEVTSPAANQLHFNFTSLFSAPGFVPVADVFHGGNHILTKPTYVNHTIDKDDNCVVARCGTYDVGHKVIDIEGVDYCCRSRGHYNGRSCRLHTCRGKENFVRPPKGYFYGNSSYCYASCVLQE